MKTGDKTNIGTYVEPADLAKMLRQLADVVERTPNKDCGAVVQGGYVQHEPHPLWDCLADAQVNVNFRGANPYIAEALIEVGAWKMPW